jgi:hypothetical protein
MHRIIAFCVVCALFVILNISFEFPRSIINFVLFAIVIFVICKYRLVSRVAIVVTLSHNSPIFMIIARKRHFRLTKMRVWGYEYQFIFPPPV